jgi:hypothetical protein
VARIRTVKPSFFRHFDLFQAEKETGLPLRVAFAGLWTVADKEGRFEWKPQEIKLDCLPHDDVDFSRVLHALVTRQFIRKYASGGRAYGWIPSFKDHQIVNNREKESSLPAFSQGLEIIEELTPGARVTHASPTRQDSGKAEQEREREQEREQEGKIEPPSAGAGAPSIRTIDLSEPDHFALPAFADRRDEGEAVQMWNDLASRLSLPRVQKLTRARESALRKRLVDCGGLEGWQAALENIEANAWMHGGNKRGWKADFDFLVQEKSFTRLMEGSYDHSPDQKPGNGFAAILAEAEQISRGGNFGPGESELQPGG